MEVVQVATGLISIPPNGWGAVERIIWEYHNNLQILDVNSSIKTWNEIEDRKDQIVHCHMANTALDMKSRGIPYIYSLHDHHAEWYGKNSGVYNYNYEAIKGSIFSICHSKHILNYFETDKLFYLSHGVNTNFFKYNEFTDSNNHSLLMVANNGIAGDVSIDRKGFIFGIEAAKSLNLPITIAGPENNLGFFEAHKYLLDYDKLTIKCNNPTDDKLLELYHNHTIFLAPSMIEYGHPNLSLLEAISCGLPVVGTCNNPPVGMIACENNKGSVIHNLKLMIEHYDFFRSAIKNELKSYDWIFVCEKLKKMYKAAEVNRLSWNSESTKLAYINAYV
jgi:glycosyltransferase involved in cell wall biosynthesis